MKVNLTASQLSLWVGQKLNPDAPLYNTASFYNIAGAIDEIIFKKAIQSLIDSTDAFRIRFDEENGVPYQWVMPNFKYEIELIDFSGHSQDPDLTSLFWDRSRQKLDLRKQVFDTVLIRINPDRYIWYINMHHLVTDAVSRKIVFNKLSQLYTGLLTNEMRPVIGNTSYLEYVEYETRQRTSRKDVNNYWESHIRGLDELPSFYGDKPIHKTTEASRVILNLGRERSEKLRTLARNPDLRSWTENLTLFNIMSSLLFIYMYRVGGNRKLTIGAPIHNRVSKKFHDTVGYLLEIFPLVTEVAPDDTFYSVLQKVRAEANDHIRHAQQDTVTSAIYSSFNTVLNYIHTSFSDFNGFQTTSGWVFPGHMDSSHQLRCHVSDFDGSGEIELFFDLNHSTFDQTLCERAPQHFLKLVDAMLTDIHMHVDHPEICVEEEKESIRKKDALAIPDGLYLEHFVNSVAENYNSVALRYGDNELTYKDLNAKVNQLASVLKHHGLMAGDNIGLYFFRCPEYIISLLAASRIGCTFVPISSDQPYDRIKYIIEDADCKVVLSEPGLYRKILSATTRVLEVKLETLNDFTSTEEENAVEVIANGIAYILYTSGSTGNPKGVLVSNGALSNYLLWARNYYYMEGVFTFPLFTSIAFDLTITSIFLPLLTGGEMVIYRESIKGPDISLMQVIEENKVNAIKLTPSHISLLQGRDLTTSKIRTVIVGGEDFKSHLAGEMAESLGAKAHIYNEYGPTEATIGCVVCEFNLEKHTRTSVPIGIPISNMNAFVMDSYRNIVPHRVIGELYVSGKGLANGYINEDDLSREMFVESTLEPNVKMYRTGDLARLNKDGILEYLGRVDDQVKLNGIRIELSDIEANLAQHPAIETTAVVLINDRHSTPENEVINCTECGLPSNFPNADFDNNGVCHLCNAFKGYKEKTDKFFKTEEELKRLLTSRKNKNGSYNCLSLLSGGKDSTFILARLLNMGLSVLAFTLDNGYISEQAKANINRIVTALGVDHIYGETPHMNKIFVDSLHRHSNVCNGCFKTIYTLSTKVALEKNIPFIVTGLSRGQFFETRLSEEIFWDDSADTTIIDDTILEARKLYHQEEDAVKQHLDVGIFNDESTFEKVQFVDFFRYSDISLGEMLRFLKEKVGWVRPTDTGRSTNCLINQLGIYVHKKEKGYSNYSFPYSWDVRLGHKSRNETLEEINEYIDEAQVKRIMSEIGYEERDIPRNRHLLVGYYTGKSKLTNSELRLHLSNKIPEYMIPGVFKYMETLPITANGKVDKAALRNLTGIQLELETTYVPPGNEIEEMVEGVWKEVLQLKKIGVHDNFIALGGHSLAAIRVTARINSELEMNLPLNKVFTLPTIAEYARFIESTILELLN